METVWMIALLIVIGVAYHWGYSNGAEQQLPVEACIELERYKIDKYFENELKKCSLEKYNELERWKAEREDKHGLPDA